MRKSLLVAVGALALGSATASNAATYIVGAQQNSSGGSGTALATGLVLTAGQIITVAVDPTDLWTAGALPRWSNADGLVGTLLATGTDESGIPAGITIGTDFGILTQDGFSAPFGALVGRIGGVYQILGTSFSGAAWATGELELFYWDSNSADNGGSVAVNIAAVPEPATWGMLILGFAAIGGALRYRRAHKVSVRFN